MLVALTSHCLKAWLVTGYKADLIHIKARQVVISEEFWLLELAWPQIFNKHLLSVRLLKVDAPVPVSEALLSCIGLFRGLEAEGNFLTSRSIYFVAS